MIPIEEDCEGVPVTVAEGVIVCERETDSSWDPELENDTEGVCVCEYDIVYAWDNVADDDWVCDGVTDAESLIVRDCVTVGNWLDVKD